MTGAEGFSPSESFSRSIHEALYGSHRRDEKDPDLRRPAPITLSVSSKFSQGFLPTRPLHSR